MTWEDYMKEYARFHLYEACPKDGYFNYLFPEFYEYIEDRGDLTIIKFFGGMHPTVRIAAVDFWFSRHYPKGREAIILNATYYNVDSSTEVEVKLDSYDIRAKAYGKILRKADRQHWGFTWKGKGK